MYRIKADGYELARNVDFDQMMNIVNHEKKHHSEIHVTEE